MPESAFNCIDDYWNEFSSKNYSKLHQSMTIWKKVSIWMNMRIICARYARAIFSNFFRQINKLQHFSEVWQKKIWKNIEKWDHEPPPHYIIWNYGDSPLVKNDFFVNDMTTPFFLEILINQYFYFLRSKLTYRKFQRFLNNTFLGISA